jgi:predicted DNA-binding ribbon-helix-helix protein
MLQKRSISIAGHRTSIALEPEFWRVLEHVAGQGNTTLPRLIAEVEARESRGGLASRLRVHALVAACKMDAKTLFDERNAPE